MQCTNYKFCPTWTQIVPQEVQKRSQYRQGATPLPGRSKRGASPAEKVQLPRRHVGMFAQIDPVRWLQPPQQQGQTEQVVVVVVRRHEELRQAAVPVGHQVVLHAVERFRLDAPSDPPV